MIQALNKQTYIGRFAPSPSGSLHFGSLVCALASYLDAKKNHGKYLLRIDNIDPPREQPGACDAIIKTLKAFHLHHDGKIIFQSERYPDYLDVCIKLIEQDLAYPCYCSRKQLSSFKQYPGTCRKILSDSEKKQIINSLKQDSEQVFHSTAQSTTGQQLTPCLKPYSVRLNIQHLPKTEIDFVDDIRGQQKYPTHFGDFIIFRKDRLPSYMLACAVDDIHDRITHIVRGADLLGSCFWQRALQYYLADQHAPDIHYAHLPLMLNEFGQKLSKQHHAQEINSAEKNTLIIKALSALGQNPPQDLSKQAYPAILSWAESHWQIENVGANDLAENSLERKNSLELDNSQKQQ